MVQTTNLPNETPEQAPQAAPADVKKEMEAITKSMELFEKLSPPARLRAFSYLASVLGIDGEDAGMSTATSGGGKRIDVKTQQRNLARNARYNTFAELYDAARPEAAAAKALVGGFWFQECEGREDFIAQEVNNELKNVGAPLKNVTNAFSALKDADPALALQVRKGGTTQQARKQYKLTVAGIRAVNEMIQRAA